MRALHLWCAVLLASGHAFAAAAAGHAPLGFEDARHLLNRTSFAAGADDIALFATLSREQAADRLLGWTAQARVTPPPEWVGEFKSARGLRQMSEEDRRAFRRDQVLKGLELRGWWLTEMLTTPSPLTEKMTLFWHNHFTSSQQKVRSPVLLYRQNALLRRYALGDFGTLLHAVARDPAMLVYLDGATSRRGQPNENFAREVMELFTLGEGHYTEQDIKEAARAFTGWSVDPETGAFLLRPLAHDDGSKTIFGRSGNFDGDGVIDLLLARPETAERIVDKLWREFVSPTPDAREVSRVARLFRENQYDTPRGAALAADVRCLLRAGESCRLDQVAGGAGGRHAAAVPLSDRRCGAFRTRHAAARPGFIRAAQRQGLAGRRDVDQRFVAARAQAVSRTAVPGARDGGAGDGGRRGWTRHAGSARAFAVRYPLRRRSVARAVYRRTGANVAGSAGGAAGEATARRHAGAGSRALAGARSGSTN